MTQTVKQRAEEMFIIASRRRETAKKEYHEAIKECAKAGVSNVKMAAIAGQTEAAIRMYRKRHGI